MFSEKNIAFLPVAKESDRIKPLLKNSFSTNFQGTGPWEGPIHFSRFNMAPNAQYPKGSFW